MVDNSPTFQRWELDHQFVQVPKGRLKLGHGQPSLRDLLRVVGRSNVETLGYCRKSLRDKDLSAFYECLDGALDLELARSRLL